MDREHARGVDGQRVGGEGGRGERGEGGDEERELHDV